MKKIFLKDMETEKRNEIIRKNQKLIERLKNYLYQAQMYWQEDEFDCIFGEKAKKAIKYHDNYASFFYTLNDWRAFITDIDLDYLSVDARKTADEVLSKIDILDAMEEYNDNYYKLEEDLEKKTKTVLKDLEDSLHSYEEYPSLEDAIQYADEMEQLNDYYIEERDDGTSDDVIRLDIAFTETFI